MSSLAVCSGAIAAGQVTQRFTDVFIRGNGDREVLELQGGVHSRLPAVTAQACRARRYGVFAGAFTDCPVLPWREMPGAVRTDVSMGGAD